MGDGKKTEFHFNFPYYENANILVTRNNAPATEYGIIGVSGGLDADIPFVGGKVVFEHAPATVDNITITRVLPLSRTVDYQPAEQINPMILNQDINYIMEVLKDFKDELGEFRTQYADITNKESTQILLPKIDAVSRAIKDLGDISSIHGNIATLNNRTANLSDYVVASQFPTAENSFTWYRKYKSGWVEQGGIKNTDGTIQTVVFPVPMQTSNYTVFVHPVNAAANPQVEIAYNNNRTTVKMDVLKVWLQGSTAVITGGFVSWEVRGQAGA